MLSADLKNVRLTIQNRHERQIRRQIHFQNSINQCLKPRAQYFFSPFLFDFLIFFLYVSQRKRLRHCRCRCRAVFICLIYFFLYQIIIMNYASLLWASTIITHTYVHNFDLTYQELKVSHKLDIVFS